MKRFIISCCRRAFVVPAVLLLTVFGGNALAQKYVRVTSADVLFDGAECLLVCESSGKAMKTGAANSKNRDAVNVTIDQTTTPYSISIGTEEVSVITLEQATDGWYLHNVELDKNGYLYVATSGSDLNTGVNTNRAVWTISPSATETAITNPSLTSRKIKYSTSNSRFAYYSNSDNTSVAIQLYMKEIACEEPSGLDYMAEDDLVMLYWDEPESGAPIFGYEVVYQRQAAGSAPVSVATQETDITLENLMPGTYTWSVRSKCGPDTYSEAVQGEEFEIEAPDESYVSPVMDEIYTIEGTQTLNKTLTFSAGNLTGNLSVSVKADQSSNGGVAVLQVSPSTISKADAEAEGGFTITLTTDVLDFDLYQDTLIFSDGGNILNKSVFMIEAVPAKAVALAESFNGCTGTSELYSPITKADNPGWTGNKLYADNGAVRVGSGSANGTLTSPALDLSLQDGEFTVVFFAKSHGGTDGKGLQVISSANDNNSTQDFTLTEGYARYEASFSNGTASTTLTFQPKANTISRFYIDSVLVYQVDNPSLSVNHFSYIAYKTDEEDEDGATRRDTLVVRGTMLKQDVSLSCPNEHFTFSPATLPMAEVMSAAGAKIYLAYTGTQENEDAYLYLSSGDVKDSVYLYAERFVKKLPVQYSKPTIKPNGGSYDDSVRVAITTTVKNAQIRYTLDGTLPTEESTLYTDTFSLFESAKLKAAAFLPDYQVTEASVTEANFTIRHFTPAPLPFDFTGGAADINITKGTKQQGLGSDYAAPCRLKFDNSGDWFLVGMDSEPDSLYFDIKGNSIKGDYVFKVEVSSDADTWSELKTYAGNGIKDGVVTSEEMKLDASVRYIRWTYETKDQGNVGLGNIHVIKPITDPTLWLSPRVAVIPAVMEGSDTAVVKVTGAVLHENLNLRLARNDRNAFSLVETSLDKDLVMNRRVGQMLHVAYTGQSTKGLDTAVVYIESGELRDSVRICASTAEVSSDCEKPENLEVVSVSATTATITFDRYIGTNYQYQYSKNQKDWSTPVTIFSASVNLEGLTPTTVYYVRLRSLCSETEVSAWCAPLRFSTTAKDPDDPDPDPNPDPDPDPNPDPDPDPNPDPDPDPDPNPTDNEGALMAGVKIYPNPSMGEFYIELNESTIVEVFNASGLRVRNETMPEGKHRLSLRGNGVYFVRLSTATSTVCKRIVVL